MAGRLLVLGGTTGTAAFTMDVVAYDPAADTWTRRSSMPVGRSFFVASAVGNEVFAIGGDRGNGARVDVYDVAADRWTTRFRPRPRLPEPGWWMAAAVANGRIFVLGGQGGTAAMPSASGRGGAVVFDPAVDGWSDLPPLPWPRFLLGAAVLGNELVALGGTAGPTGKPGEAGESAAAAALPLGP